MAETITKEEWGRLAQLSPEKLRAAAAQQLALTDRALAVAPGAPRAIGQLWQQAQAELTRGDAALGETKLQAYKAAYSKARWALDELGPVLRSAGQGGLFEELDAAARAVSLGPTAPAPAPPATPAPTPTPATPAPPAKPAKPKQAETKSGNPYRAELQELMTRPPAQLRALAVEQRDKITAKLKANKDLIGSVLQRWKQYDEAVDQINAWIARGDSFSGKSDPAAQTDAAKWYASALLHGQRFATLLDREISEGGSAVLLLTSAVDAAEQGAREAGRKVAETAKETGDVLKTSAYILAGGAALGIAAAIFSRGRRPEETRPEPAPGDRLTRPNRPLVWP